MPGTVASTVTMGGSDVERSVSRYLQASREGDRQMTMWLFYQMLFIGGVSYLSLTVKGLQERKWHVQEASAEVTCKLS